MAPQLTPISYVPTAPDAADPTPSRAIEWTGFHKLVSTVTGAGIAPPPAFVALAEGYGRLQTFASGNGRTMQSRLVEGLISGATGDLEALFAAALIERAVNSGGVIAAELLEEIRGAVLDALRKIYAPTVVRTYRTLAGKFNDTAQAFHRAAATISPAASSDVAAEAPRGVLEAWHDGLRHAKTLESLVEPLSCAAELWRPIEAPSAVGGDRATFTLPLCVDLDGVGRRAAWAAWHDADEPQPAPAALTMKAMQPQPARQPTRGGRWARLVAAGAIIRADDDPTDMALFGQPQPFARKLIERRVGDNLKQEWAVVDPEAGTEAPKRRPVSALRAYLRRRHPDIPEVIDIVAGVADAEEHPGGN